MFGTLKVGKKNNAGTMVFAEQYKQARGTPGSPHSACKTCRDRKLKCTREADGCKRCKSSNVTCEYPSPAEDKRGNKSRKAQSSTASAGSSSTCTKHNSSKSDTRQSSEEAASSASNEPSATTQDMDVDFSMPSFMDSGLQNGFYNDLAGMDTPGFLQSLEQNKAPDIEDPNFFQQNFEFDMLADLALPPIDLANYAMSTDSDTDFGAGASLGDSSDSAFMEMFLAPRVEWQQGDTSSLDSASVSGNFLGKSGRTSRASTASSRPTPSLGYSKPSTSSSLQQQAHPEHFSQEPGSTSDSDSSSKQCRCSDRALRLLEKLPNTSSSTGSSPIPGSSQSSSPERMDTSFPPEVHMQTTQMGKAHFIQAASLFLGHFSRYLAVFSAITQCQSCLRESSFSMILLMLAQRLTSRVGLLLRKYSPEPSIKARPQNQKLMLTIAESAIVYEDSLPLVSTLLAGKVCRLAACITRVKNTCLMYSWTSYAKGFDALETPLRERMADLEAMM
ncbi:hypothetical protein GGS20DRAFT_526516 [Poronia punctata]|nr:hypothetical protein GGS20DRAFT_526516 [Poronia punctata]